MDQKVLFTPEGSTAVGKLAYVRPHGLGFRLFYVLKVMSDLFLVQFHYEDIIPLEFGFPLFQYQTLVHPESSRLHERNQAEIVVLGCHVPLVAENVLRDLLAVGAFGGEIICLKIFFEVTDVMNLQGET